MSKDDKKPLKVVFAKHALDTFPEDEREKIAKELEEIFKGENPAEIGTPIKRLSAGTYNCPSCGAKLEQGPVIQMPIDGDVDKTEPIQIFDCTECNHSFFGNLVN